MRPSRAFTLLETVVVIAVTMIVMLALGWIIQFFYKSDAYLLEQTQAVESARRSVESIVQNLREASYAADGSYPIGAALPATITFYADIMGSSDIERVRYYLDGTTLYRGVTVAASNPPTYQGEPETVTLVVDNVQYDVSTPLFTYYDSTGVNLGATPNLVKITSVRVAVFTDVNPNRTPTIYALSSGATLRNLEPKQ